MKYNVVVATHHKTGTVWMDGVFKAIADDVGAHYVDFRSEYGRLERALQEPFILFNYDSDFRDHAHLLDRKDVRILHLIRDPRDVLISAMHYHKKSAESWLHTPVPGYNNVTYQRRLRELPTRLDQYVFEMEHSTAGTLRGVMGWQYGRANCFEARYEALRQDTDLTYWTRIADFLGFDESERQSCRRRFWQNSLFGGLSRLGNKHVRSGDVAQWKREFNRELAYAFLDRFPSVLQSLGYEPDNKWLFDVPGPEANELNAVLKRLVGSPLESLKDLGRNLATRRGAIRF
jgi:Sulfotransferase domain